MIFSGLINNIALIIALSIFYSFIIRRWKYGSRLAQTISGFLFGAVAVVGMMNPFIFSPGLIFDGRSIIISIAGFIGGWVPALIAALMGIIYRAWIGGPGAIMGVSVIASSAAIGMAYHTIRRHRPYMVTPLYLIGFGVIVHLCMLALTMTLPSGMKLQVFSNIALPVILIYPLGTLLVGVVFLDLESRLRAEEALRESEIRFRTFNEMSPLGISFIDVDGRYEYVNPAFVTIFGWDLSDIPTGRDWFKLAYPDPDYRRQVIADWQEDLGRYKEQEIRPRTYEVMSKDGTRKTVLFKPITLPSGKQFILYEDITERKLAEDLARLRLTLWEFAATHSLAELLQKTLDEVGTLTNSPIGFFHFVEKDQKTLSLQAWSTKTIKEFCRAEGRGMHYRIDQAGVWVDCVHERRPVIHNDYQSLPHRKGMPEGHATVIRELVVPIMRSDRIVAILGIGNKPTDYIEEDIKIVSYLADVTWEIAQRKQAQEALLALSWHQEALLSAIPDIIMEVDEHKIYTWANGPGLEFFGQDVIGQEASFYFEGEQKTYDIVKPLFNGDENVIYLESWQRRQDGQKRLLAWWCRALKDAEGRGIGALSTARDITDRKRAEESLRESEEKYRNILESIEEGYYEVDLAGNLIFFNDAICTMLGYSRSELMGMNNRQFTEENNLMEMYRVYNEVYRTGKPAEGFEWQAIRKDGVEGFGEVSVSLIKDDDGRPIGFRGIARDVTHRKLAEQEKQKLLVQLQQAQKMESVGRLAGGVAHDFNNLLTAIIGNAEMALMDEDKEGSTAEVLGEIIKAGERAAGLTRQLLAFSRKQVIQPEVADLNEVVSEMANILRRLIGEDIELTTLLAPDPGRVEVDVGQIEQVIMNLAVNARDSMPGGGKLTIETADVELDEEYAAGHVAVSPGPYVLLSVSDNGIGMTPEVQEQIFEPFFTTKEKGRGTGLGLATVYGIIKQSRGNIWVYSEPGQGTTFKIYLPRLAKSVEEVKRPGPKAEFRGGSETVLLVEDEEGIRNLAFKMLQRFGYHVLTAKDGQEASELFERHGDPIDLLLTDVVMPRMSGRELAERLEGLQAGIKVLFMSGYTDNAIVHHGILDKGIAFIQKPFTPEDLVRKVREVLDS